MAEIAQVAGVIVQLGLFGFVINWAKSAIIDKVADHERRIQKVENFKEFEEKYLKKN